MKAPNRQEFAATEALYNATSFNVEQEVEFMGISGTDNPESTLIPNHTVKVFRRKKEFRYA